jgi:hypothetical protein
MMPYKSRAGLSWGPTIGRRLYKMFWMKEFRNPSSWTRGVCQQGMLMKNVPIISELSQQIDYLLRGKCVTKQRMDIHRPWHYFDKEQAPWDDVTLNWMCERYSGLTVEMIKRDLRIIRTIDRLPAVVRLESLVQILQHDEL